MDLSLITPLLYVLATPLVTLMHELGHAAVPLAVSRKPVTVQVGPAFSRPLFRARLGRVTVVVRRLFFWGGRCDSRAPLTAHQQFWTAAGGPLVSLLILGLGAAALLGVQTETAWMVAQVFMTLSFCQLLLTLWPTRYPAWVVGFAGMESDGAQLLRLWPRLRAA